MKRQTTAQFTRALKREVASLKKNIRVFYKSAGEISRAEREKDFDAGRGPDGSQWQGLAKETIKRKRGTHTSQKMKRKGGISGLSSHRAKPSATPSKPLIDQGVLKGLDVKIERGRVVMRPWESRREVVTSGGQSIAGIHEKRYKTRPKRHHWGISKNAVPRIVRAWNALIKEFIKGVS